MSRRRQLAGRVLGTQSSDAHRSDDLWKNDPALIKEFIAIRPEYEQLCAEVEYILRKRISTNGIETSFVGSRAKTLNSFIEKLKRKSYLDPLTQLTDFAGARVVCLYNNDIPKVAEIIRKEFKVIEEIDKLDALDDNKFGYIGRHFIVQLGRNSSGARYDDLKTLSCEIQVRTVVQDAWSIIQHHMAYKNEAQVPKQLLRKLNSLAGLFETVDDQFELIKAQRDSYVVDVRESTAHGTFLGTEINYDSFLEFLKWRFKDRPEDEYEYEMSIILDALNSAEFRTLGELNDYLNSTTDQVEKMYALLWSLPSRGIEPGKRLVPSVEIALHLSIDPRWRGNFPWSEEWMQIMGHEWGPE